MKKHLFFIVLVVTSRCYAPRLMQNELGELMSQKADELVHAAYKGDQQKVTALLEAGVAVNAADQGGRTALINAALQSHEHLFSVLFEHGADPNVADRQKITPLIAAVMSYANNQDVAEIKQMVDILIEKGAYVNAQNIGGQTALMIAANFGLKGVVKKLLKAGADDQMRNGFGQKAIDLVNIDCPVHALLK